MIIKELYRYTIKDAVVDCLSKLNVDYILRYRLVAENDKVLTKDDQRFCRVIDINAEDLDLWREVENPKRSRIKQFYTTH
jgi:hypothetical protein